MNRYFTIILLLLITLILTSCGHSGVFYGEGTTLNVNTQGLTYIKGKGIWDFSRENTALVVEAKSGDGIIHDGENSFKSHVIVKKTVGKQVLGYTVDLAKRSPEAVVEWLKNAESPNNETGGLIEDK